MTEAAPSRAPSPIAARAPGGRRLGAAALGVVALIALGCFVGPFLYHSDQLNPDLVAVNLPPGAGHPLGTDAEGFDILGRLLAGGRSSLEVGLSVSLLATCLGVAWGLVAALAGGIVDAVMMRVVDVLLAVPVLFVLVFLGRLYSPNLVLVVSVLALFSWLGPSRLVRGEALSLKTREFVEAARAAGSGRRRILLRHLLPNVAGTVAVSATFQVADAMLALATLGFLGLGLPPPQVSWGAMLAQGTTYLLDGYWWEVYPAGVMIMVSVVAFNFLGDALRDLLDARTARR